MYVILRCINATDNKRIGDRVIDLTINAEVRKSNLEKSL